MESELHLDSSPPPPSLPSPAGDEHKILPSQPKEDEKRLVDFTEAELLSRIESSFYHCFSFKTVMDYCNLKYTLGYAAPTPAKLVKILVSLFSTFEKIRNFVFCENEYYDNFRSYITFTLYSLFDAITSQAEINGLIVDLKNLLTSHDPQNKLFSEEKETVDQDSGVIPKDFLHADSWIIEDFGKELLPRIDGKTWTRNIGLEKALLHFSVNHIYPVLCGSILSNMKPSVLQKLSPTVHKLFYALTKERCESAEFDDCREVLDNTYVELFKWLFAKNPADYALIRRAMYYATSFGLEQLAEHLSELELNGKKVLTDQALQKACIAATINSKGDGEASVALIFYRAYLESVFDFSKMFYNLTVKQDQQLSSNEIARALEEAQAGVAAWEAVWEKNPAEASSSSSSSVAFSASFSLGSKSASDSEGEEKKVRSLRIVTPPTSPLRTIGFLALSQKSQSYAAATLSPAVRSPSPRLMAAPTSPTSSSSSSASSSSSRIGKKRPADTTIEHENYKQAKGLVNN